MGKYEFITFSFVSNLEILISNSIKKITAIMLLFSGLSS